MALTNATICVQCLYEVLFEMLKANAFLGLSVSNMKKNIHTYMYKERRFKYKCDFKNNLITLCLTAAFILPGIILT